MAKTAGKSQNSRKAAKKNEAIIEGAQVADPDEAAQGDADPVSDEDHADGSNALVQPEPSAPSDPAAKPHEAVEWYAIEGEKPPGLGEALALLSDEAHRRDIDISILSRDDWPPALISKERRKVWAKMLIVRLLGRILDEGHMPQIQRMLAPRPAKRG